MTAWEDDSGKKKRLRGTGAGFPGSDLGEGVLSKTADGAYPIVRNVL